MFRATQTPPPIKWSAQNISFDELVPPPKGEVVINRLGTVVMNIDTYNEYQNIAEGEAIRLGRFEDGKNR